MKISTKGRYGLRVMIQLAQQFNAKPLSMTHMSKEQDISKKYLHTILTKLKDAKLINCYRGKNGGYTLSRTPAEITASQILIPLEGPIQLVNCVNSKHTCLRQGQCNAHNLWCHLSTEIEELLDGVTLESLK